MDCPNCEIALRPFKIGSVSLDECARCKGIWFDKKELEEVKDEIDPELRWLDLKIWHPQTRFQITDQPHDCPACKKVTMRTIHYQEPDVDVSFCPLCQGTWLDSGDLGKIIEALGKEADSRSIPSYVKDSLKEASEILTRPQNMISEWQDLKAVLRLLTYRIFVENPKLKSILLGIQKSLPL